MSKQGLEARRAAAEAMTAVTEKGQLLSVALPKATKDLTPADAARAGRLATGALRWAQKSDRLLGPHLRLKPEDSVMNLMRLALYEIHVTDVAPHGAVDSAVSLASRSKSGLVNGVLRNVQRRGTDWDSLPVPSLPKWLRKPLGAAWGKEAVAVMESVHAGEPPLDVTPKKTDLVQKLAEQLNATLLPTGSLRLEAAGQVTALPGFDEGDWWVQDAGAAIAAKVLAAKPGEQVLDLCAAPGGKTMQLAAAGADVTALDISEDRMARVRENLERSGLKAKLIVEDALTYTPDTKFDAILLDAPCSATGTLRRHPDLPFAKDGSELPELIQLQATLLDRALDWLKPDGRLVFCTCSLLPDEGENQIAKVMQRHPNLRSIDPEQEMLDPKWGANAGLRIRPDHWSDLGGIDGFFVALLQNQP